MANPWETVELEVCTDCVLTLANGPDEDLDPERAAAITAGIAALAGDGYRLEVGVDQLGFSWAHCDLCGDGCGGDRHQAWALRPPARKETTMQALIHDDAAWWLAPGDALMVAPIDPATGTPAWDHAHRADPMAHRDPNLVLTIADTLITAAHGQGPVPLEQVVNTSRLRPGYLVRDPSGTDLARYDRLDLAQQAAALAGGGIYAWGQIGAGPVGWHQIDLARPAARGAQRTAATTPTELVLPAGLTTHPRPGRGRAQ
jgi:hypothetical protein